MSKFKIIARQKGARAGVLETPHGLVETPIFMPVGTQASVKSLSPEDLKECGAQIILGNTYHLYLRPGSKLIKKLGGLHKFMGWEGPILTDSGGFQAFSLGAMIEHGVRKVPKTMDKKKIEESGVFKNTIGKTLGDIVSHSSVKKLVDKREKSSKGGEGLLKTALGTNLKISGGDKQKIILSTITEEGVLFTSHLDGSKHLLTPEKSIEVQLDLGADIVLTLDELLSPLHDYTYAKKSLDRTHRWEVRSQLFFEKNKKSSPTPSPLLFGILQGVYDQKIRVAEAKWVANQGFDGISIGGSFGVSEFYGGQETDWAAQKAIADTLDWITPLLPERLPRHILGIGEVEDFFICIERGADMFDCVAPTRRARNGSLYISPKSGGKVKNKFCLNISRSEYKDDPSPIDKYCLCYTCQNFSKAYLRHLYMSGELLFHRLATIHNVYFMVNLTKRIREAIIKRQFQKLKKSWIK